MLVAVQNKGGQIKPTHLMYNANLSHSQMKLYLEEILSEELIHKIKKGHYDYLIITDKGCRFIEKLRDMREFEKTLGI